MSHKAPIKGKLIIYTDMSYLMNLKLKILCSNNFNIYSLMCVLCTFCIIHLKKWIPINLKKKNLARIMSDFFFIVH